MGPGAPLIGRRTLLGLPLALAACSGERAAPLEGGWVGASHGRGHRLRSGAWPAPSVQRRAGVLVVGGGIAGLAALRALHAAGVDDARLLELEDEPGGNSRGHAVAGMACPLGAHYLPLPGEAAHEVRDWLREIGIARFEFGRWRYDERHLCHAPQERLYVDGAWHDGLLPPAEGAAAAQYRRFGREVAHAMRLGFSVPSARSPWTAGHAALDAQTFDAWLDARGLADARLRWLLDYSCRDDYGAGTATVSAWAGLHYFASRHGFHAGDDDGAAERDQVLTWPEGNAWLARRLAAPRAEQLHPRRLVWRVEEGRHDVTVDAWDDAARQVERWQARHVVLALPLFVAARLLAAPPPALRTAAAQMCYAPWLVANLHLDGALLERSGAPPSWDNVVYGSPMLGWVDAMHQTTRPHAGPTVLTAYWALPESERAALLQRPWQDWARAVVDEMARVQPDLPRRLARIDLMRYGHAMSVPVPGARGSAALRALAAPQGRVHFAHADLAGYSVFEEAFVHGTAAAATIARTLRTPSTS